ncbi:MAG TPA: hypothetical protein VLA52_07720 [Thermohalobaculum sp.]|nr:hypothetical protein [Thermohalobaculum sp.]
MSDGDFIADTLEAILVGMAESLRDAQEALNAAPSLDNFGRPAPRYQIPSLDFEIGFRLATETKQSGGARLLMMPVKTGETSSEVTSRITGRFVAVPPGDGLPLPVLTAAATRDAGGNIVLAVSASNSAGEVLTGVPIELNFDMEASRALSQAAGVQTPRLAGAVTLGDAVLVTDETGQAATSVSLAPSLQRQAVVVLSAELGSEMVRVTLSKEIG